MQNFIILNYTECVKIKNMYVYIYILTIILKIMFKIIFIKLLKVDNHFVLPIANPFLLCPDV